MAEAAQAPAGTVAGIRRVPLDRPWQWLAAGWSDLLTAPVVGACYGLLFAAVGYAITFGLYWSGMIYLTLPAATGFLLLGPLLAVSLYEVSRRLGKREPVSLALALGAWRRNSSQIWLMGLVLLLISFVWLRIAGLLFMLYFGVNPPSFAELVPATFFNPDALPFVILGTVVGGVLAAAVLAISVVSIPMLLDRPEADVFQAIRTSVAVVQANPATMAFWGALVVLFVGAGVATLYVGLIVALPLIGHASWHAYRDLVLHEP
jgi:uncharacterized membrane protein